MCTKPPGPRARTCATEPGSAYGTLPASAHCAWISQRHLIAGKASIESTSSTSPSDKHSETVNSDQAPPPAPPPRRRSFPRLLLVAAFLLVGLPLVLLAGIYLILLTEPGRSGLASLIESSVSQPDGLQLEIGRLEGPLPQRIEIGRASGRERVGMAQADGSIAKKA